MGLMAGLMFAYMVWKGFSYHLRQKPSFVINLSNITIPSFLPKPEFPGNGNTASDTRPNLSFSSLWRMGFNKSWQSDEIKSASHGLQLLQLLNYSAYLSTLALSSPALSYITITVILLDSDCWSLSRCSDRHPKRCITPVRLPLP